MNNPTTKLLQRLLKSYKIEIDRSELEFQFQSHPSYPSLHAVTGVLNHFKIPNIALKLPKSKELINELPVTFLALVVNNNREKLAFIELAPDTVEITYDDKKRHVLTIDEFLELWSGIIVSVEKDENVTEKSIKKHKTKSLIYYLVIICAIAAFALLKPTVFQWVHFILALAGIHISKLLVEHELGISSLVLDKVCSGTQKNFNCDDVLSSKASSLFGKIKLSDIGIVYFCGTVISWLITAYTTIYIEIITIGITLAAIPFTIYSVYQQKIIIKKWCPLCLGILMVLWGQALSVFLNTSLTISFSIQSIIPVLTGIGVMSIIWSVIKPLLIARKELTRTTAEYNRFKRNYNVFKGLLSHSTYTKTNIEECVEITFGKNGSTKPIEIILITNPSCGHCKNAHKAIMPLLKTHIDAVTIVVRFNVPANNTERFEAKAALSVLSHYKNKSEEETMDILHELYLTPDINNWLKKWETSDKLNYLNDLNRQKEWCLENDKHFTPAVLLNGYSFPKEYEFSDIQYFIDEIVEDRQYETI